MKRLCNHAIIIGLDGAGNAPRDCATPCMDAVCDRGVVTYAARTSFPSSSGECWGSLFHGVGREKHGLDNAVVESSRYPEDSPYPSFMKLARERWPDSTLASFSNWAPINHGIIEGSCACHLESLEDDALTDSLVAYIGSHDPRILFVQMDHIDHAGHAFGYWTPEYYAQVRQNDALIGRILDAFEARGMLHDSLVLLCADHGGGGANPRSHGSADAKDMTIFWGCSGPSIRRGQVITAAVNIKDTAAVVARALGLEVPTGWDCRVPYGIFDA